MRPRVLVLCYGNPGRLDDGLGPAAGAALEAQELPGVTVDVDYQLTVEDAALAAEHDVVLFVDAAARGAEPFFLAPVEPAGTPGFTTHGVDPGAVLSLAAQLSGRAPDGYALGIRGYDFDDFGERLSTGASLNLDAALHFLRPLLVRRNFRAAATALSRPESDPTATAPTGTEN